MAEGAVCFCACLDNGSNTSPICTVNKQLVIQQVRDELHARFDLVKRAADVAREDATDEESRARSKYETQGLEASYLAAGQAQRAEEIAQAMEALSAEEFAPVSDGDPIGEGALVEVDLAGETEWFLLTPCSGGLTLFMDGTEVTLLAPGAPLRDELIGLKKGDRVNTRKLEVRSVC
jgi:hypothetical protein